VISKEKKKEAEEVGRVWDGGGVMEQQQFLSRRKAAASELKVAGEKRRGWVTDG